MKRWVVDQFGDVTKILKQQTIPIPEPKQKEVLIKVKATSLNPVVSKNKNQT